MKVLDLLCAQHHSFEGWFGSEDDFQSQLARGLVQCPVCGDAHISKKLSAPRLNFGKAAAPRHSAAQTTTQAASASAPASAPAAATGLQEHADATRASDRASDPASLPIDAAVQKAFMRAVREVMANTEDVGRRFAEEARKIHYGETPERGIRGQATAQEAQELLEEGVAVMPLPVPQALKGPVH